MGISSSSDLPSVEYNTLIVCTSLSFLLHIICTMAFSRLIAILSFLSLAIFAYAAPSSSLSALTTRSNKVHFEVTLTWEDYSPSGGKPRKMILTNGTFPGPEHSNPAFFFVILTIQWSGPGCIGSVLQKFWGGCVMGCSRMACITRSLFSLHVSHNIGVGIPCMYAKFGGAQHIMTNPYSM